MHQQFLGRRRRSTHLFTPKRRGYACRMGRTCGGMKVEYQQESGDNRSSGGVKQLRWSLNNERGGGKGSMEDQNK